MSIPLPATEVAKLYAALDAAIEHVDQHDNAALGPLWLQLVHARSFVKCYLLEQMPAVEVDVTQPEKVEA